MGLSFIPRSRDTAIDVICLNPSLAQEGRTCVRASMPAVGGDLDELYAVCVRVPEIAGGRA